MKRIIILIICLLLCGCYDYKELNSIDIITGVGIDYIDGEYKVTLEILNAIDKDNNSKEDITSLVSSSDEIFSKAVEDNYNKLTNEAYFSHLEVMVINEEAAKLGIKDIADYILRSTRVGNNFYLVVIKDNNAEDVFKLKSNNHESIANEIVKLLHNANSDYIVSINNEFDYLVSNMISKGIDITTPNIIIDNDAIKLDSVAYFKDDKMISYLSKEEAITLNLLIADSNNYIYMNINNTSINVYDNSYKYNINKDKIIIDTTLDTTLKTIDNDDNLNVIDTFNKIEDKFSSKYLDDCNNLILKMKDENIDLLGIGNKYYRYYPRLYYDNILNDLEIIINAKVNINKNGSTFEVIK